MILYFEQFCFDRKYRTEVYRIISGQNYYHKVLKSFKFLKDKSAICCEENSEEMDYQLI